MEKRNCSMFIPYYFKDKNLYVFLQRRSENAQRNPNSLGGFGGGVEGKENNEQALLRELYEELEYIPKKYSILGVFETDYSVSNYYIEEVSENFEDNINVREGKYGEWHNIQEVVERNDVSLNTKKVINEIIKKLNK